jgi:integrase
MPEQIVNLRDTVNELRKIKRINDKTFADYNNAISAIRIENLEEKLLPFLFEILTPLIEKKPGYLGQYYAVIRSTAKKYGWKLDSPEHFTFYNLLKTRKKKVVIPYTLDDVKCLLRIAKFNEINNFSLYKLFLVLAYSGARVSSLRNNKLSDWQPVPNIENVFFTKVVVKAGRTAPIFLPRHLVEHLYYVNAEGDDRLTNWSPERKETFRDYVRSRLAYKYNVYKRHVSDEVELKTLNNLFVTHKDENGEQKRLDKSALHSFRKFFAVQNSLDPALQSDLIVQGLLMTHVINQMTYKAYVLSNGANWDSSVPRIAEAYSRSQWMKLKLWEGTEPRI